MVFNQRGAQSTIKDKFKPIDKKTSSNPTWIIVIAAIIIYTIAVYYLIDIIGNNEESQVA
jgi:uncharacterized membrane protein (DUF106 family)